MRSNNRLFNLSVKFQNAFKITVIAIISAMALYSLLYLLIPFESYLTGLLLSFLIATLIAYPLGMLVIAFNRTMKRQAEQTQANNEIKTRLIYILGHDIKSPLNNIKRVISLVSKEGINASEFKELTNQLYTDVDNTLMLTNNLINWIKIQKDDIEPNRIQFNIQELIGETIELYKPIARTKNISLQFHTNEKELIYSDPEMCKIVLRNLISNAIKFSELGGAVEIGFRTENEHLLTWVKDEGVGIGKKKLETLFIDEFVPSEPGTKKEKGTGLGLHLSKQIIDSLHGKIWVESNKNIGSSFYFYLPKN